MLRLPLCGLNAQSNTGRCSGLRPLLNGLAVFLNVFNRVEFLDVRDDVLDFRLAVTEPAQRIRHAAIDDLQHAAAGEQFVFHERDVGFDAGRVAIHQERNGAGRREHGDLRVAIAVLPALGQRAVPGLARLVLEIIEFLARLDCLRRRRGAV